MRSIEKVQEFIGVTPSHEKAEREEVRAMARKKATSAWFRQVLDHHEMIEAAFDAVKQARSNTARLAAQKELMHLLTGHSIAEEAIIYPFMQMDTSARHATHAYAEQALAKVGMAELDAIKDKMSEEYEEKLDSICKAVLHHMIEEERDFFPELQKKADSAHNQKISQQYKAEFIRYMGDIV